MAVTSSGIADVKSVYAGERLGIAIGAGTTFVADTVLDSLVNIGIATFSAESTATSTIIAPTGSNLLTQVKQNDILQYSNPVGADPELL